MARKIRLPDEDVEPIWDKMDKAEQEWYELFKKATEYHNWAALQMLCDLAPTDQFERLKEEINYESHRMDRERYTIPKSNFPAYSEWDYSWASPRASKRASKQDNIDKSYDAPATSKNMKWAK